MTAFPRDARLAARIHDVQRAMPMTGCAVGIVDRDGVSASWCAGTTDVSGRTPIDTEVWWDLASLTKTLVTLPAVLRLVESGIVDLDTPLETQWQRAAGKPFGVCTPAHLLSHLAGLPAHLPFYELDLRPRARLMEEILSTELTSPPGTSARYSDIGFMILGELVEHHASASLRDLTGTTPGMVFGPVQGVAAATEICPWRERLIVGEVHDENAYALDGVAGHAGAFGTIAGVLDAVLGHLRDETPLHRRSVQEHSTNLEDERFGLGWWLPPTREIGGTRWGPGSYGMSGFTGNRLWVEPGRGYAVVVLSNRVHPVRGDREPFTRWCTQLLDTVADARQGWDPTLGC